MTQGQARLGRIALLAAFLVGAVASAVTTAAEHTTPVVLDQGWTAATRHRYYYESQGTRFMPAAILNALETPAGERFMAPANMRRFGFLVDDGTATPSNPYGWPIGFAIDNDKSGVKMAGFTCAACHTSNLAYRGTTIRIDGGQAGVAIDSFRRALAQAVIATGTDPARRKRFESQAVSFGFPAGHIDAAFQNILQKTVAQAKAAPDAANAPPAGGPGRLDALSAIATAVFSTDLGVPANARSGAAPVDFPYLWDIWRFDWVQYNASVEQPMNRNIGEALGVGLQTHFIDPAGGALNAEPLRWQTTARVHNLYWMESVLTSLKAPPWPEATLGAIDRAQAARGRALFVQNCAACHGIKRIEASKDPVVWHVPVIPLKRIATDANQATDYAKHRFDGTKLGLGAAVSTADALGFVVNHVKKQAYVDAGIPKPEWPKYDGFGRPGDYFPAPCAYKARPLMGVWATGPFLHNGSVPTVYDLLSESRPKAFSFGNREFDPKKLGFVQTAGPNTMVLDTSLDGNHNAGHWFTDDRTRPGRIGRALSDSEKFAIIEYLKAATPANYPSEVVSKPGPLPCASDKNWAR